MLVRLLGKTGFVEKESLLKRGINSTKKDRSNARGFEVKKIGNEKSKIRIGLE